MTFLLDQDAPHDLVYSLHALNHDVVLLRDILPITSVDEDVLRYAAEKKYVVITCNRDDFWHWRNEYRTPGLLFASNVKAVPQNERPLSNCSIAPVKLE